MVMPARSACHTTYRMWGLLYGNAAHTTGTILVRPTCTCVLLTRDYLTLYIPYSNLGLPYSILVRHRVNKYTIIVPPLLPMDAQFNQSVVAGRVWSILGPRRSAKHRRAVGNVLRERCRYPWICEHRQARYALCCAACCLSASLFSFIA